MLHIIKIRSSFDVVKHRESGFFALGSKWTGMISEEKRAVWCIVTLMRWVVKSFEDENLGGGRQRKQCGIMYIVCKKTD